MAKRPTRFNEIIDSALTDLRAGFREARRGRCLRAMEFAVNAIRLQGIAQGHARRKYQTAKQAAQVSTQVRRANGISRGVNMLVQRCSRR